MKKKYTSFLLITLALIFSSCKKGDIKSKLNLKPVYEPIDIPISPPQLGRYTKLFYNDEENYLAGLNHVAFQIDIFDLEKRKFVRSISLAQDGPNMVPAFREFAMKGDSIIIRNVGGFTVLNTNGEVLKRVNIQDFSGTDLDVYNLYAPGVTIASPGNYLTVNWEEGYIISPLYKRGNRTDEGFYNGPLLAKINLSEDKIEALPLSYPDKLKNEGLFFGNVDKTRSLLKKDSLVYFLLNSSKIHYYNLSSKELKSFNPQSQLVKNQSKTYPKEQYDGIDMKVWMHQFSANQFYSLQYDKYNKLYYRTYKGETEVKAGEYFDWSKNYFMVMDENFQVLKELKLDENTEPIFFITEKGVLFQQKESVERGENYLSFIRLSWEEEK